MVFTSWSLTSNWSINILITTNLFIITNDFSVHEEYYVALKQWSTQNFNDSNWYLNKEVRPETSLKKNELTNLMQ